MADYQQGVIGSFCETRKSPKFTRSLLSQNEEYLGKREIIYSGLSTGLNDKPENFPWPPEG